MVKAHVDQGGQKHASGGEKELEPPLALPLPPPERVSKPGEQGHTQQVKDQQTPFQVPPDDRPHHNAHQRQQEQRQQGITDPGDELVLGKGAAPVELHGWGLPTKRVPASFPATIS